MSLTSYRYGLKGNVIDRLLYQTADQGKDPPNRTSRFTSSSTGCLWKQWRNRSDRIDDYIAIGGYQGLEKVLSEMDRKRSSKPSRNRAQRPGGGDSHGAKWRPAEKQREKKGLSSVMRMRETLAPTWTVRCWRETPTA